MTLFKVVYKPVGRGRQTAIVNAENQDEATKHFNNPDEIGLDAEIVEVTEPRTLPKGWMVRVESEPFAQYVLKDQTEVKAITLRANNRSTKAPANLDMKDVVSVTPPSRDRGKMKTMF